MFYHIFDQLNQINAAFMGIRDFFQKLFKNVTEPKLLNSIIYVIKSISLKLFLSYIFYFKIPHFSMLLWRIILKC